MRRILLSIGAFVFIMVSISSCSTVRAMYGIPEPKESEASIRKKITSAVDNASPVIIRNLPDGIRLAVISGSSSRSDQEIVFSYMKNQGYSDSEAHAAIREMGNYVSVMAAQIKTQGTSSENGYGDYAVEDLEYNLINAGSGFRLIDRQQIARIRNEQQFQMSGEVDDSSAVNIGKMTGANVVIVISISYIEKSGRLILKALDVQTSEIITMARQEF